MYLFYGFEQKKNDKIIYLYECVCVICPYNLNITGVFNGSHFQSEIEMTYKK